MKRKCRFCKRYIKMRGNIIILAHRKCWLNYRSFNLKQFDYLFCPKRYRGTNISILPATPSPRASLTTDFPQGNS